MGLFSKLLNPFASDGKGKDDVKDELPEAEEVIVRDDHVSTDPPQGTGAFVSNVVELRDSAKNAITGAIVRFTGKDDFLGMKIWINDSSFSEINSDSFKKDLRAVFDDMHFYSLGSGTLEVVYGIPGDGVVATEVQRGLLWIQLLDRTSVAPASTKARVSVVMGMGALEEEAYELDSGVKDRFRIGRGKICRKAGSYRVNDIIISETHEDPEIAKLNKHVSSSQADIVVREGVFYLQAMPSGCRPLGGAPTKIIRDQQVDELRDASSYLRLQDGDMIELGKSVLLLFEYL